MNKQSNILVVGSSNTDMVVQVPHLPTPGETVLGGVFQQAAGGKGANQAVAAQRCGGHVAFVACVGDDALGAQAIHGYKKDGIDVNAIVVDKKEPSGVAIIVVNKEGENSIAVASGANMALTTDHIDQNKSRIEQSGIVLLQLETTLSIVQHTIELAAQSDTTIILNPAPAQPLSDELLSKVTILTPNETEASMLTNIKVTDADSAKQAAQWLLDKGVQHVIITMGGLGTFYMSATQQKMFTPFKVDPVDTTGAGDTFNGALAAALSQQKEMTDAINFAQAAAALSVTKRGAQPSVPTLAAVLEFLAAAP
ncbi:MAG: ribokinase [Coxiella sp. (in: Bacteria)]|nr:MAG: ribokinase [Coxiella sp. (in: g-proteobacteria)]